MDNPKKIIGILGGIGSGKSSVSAEFARLGCGVIDADAIASDLLEQQNIQSELINAFGEKISSETGEIDRNKLGEEVFKSEKNVKLANSIFHPPILRQAEKLIDKYSQAKEIKAIVLDMPLLMEVGWQNKCDKLIFVDSTEENREIRAANKDPKNKKNLKNREKFQNSLDKKKQIAHYIINNNSNFSALADQVERIFSIIINK